MKWFDYSSRLEPASDRPGDFAKSEWKPKKETFSMNSKPNNDLPQPGDQSDLPPTRPNDPI
jgi:hypothetical protein